MPLSGALGLRLLLTPDGAVSSGGLGSMSPTAMRLESEHLGALHLASRVLLPELVKCLSLCLSPVLHLTIMRNCVLLAASAAATRRRSRRVCSLYAASAAPFPRLKAAHLP